MNGPLSLYAPAKVNLFLHVLRRLPDGYHELESLIVFVDVGDRLSVSEASGFQVEVGGPFANLLSDEPVSDNLVHRAGAQLMARAGAEFGGHLRLEKNLPVAAGLGGGSADAAAALRLLKDFWRLDVSRDDLQALGLELGADIPVCLDCRPAFVGGIGEDLTPAGPLPDAWAVLVNSGTPVPTGKVFKGLDPDNLAGQPGPSVPAEDFADARRLGAALARTRNDLEASALRVAPDIADVIGQIERQPGCLLARMSGSGGTCFGLFETRQEAEEAARRIAAHHPRWWAQAGRLLQDAPGVAPMTLERGLG